MNIACSVRRCKSVNTSRGFFGDDRCSATTGISSFRLHPVNGISNQRKKIKMKCYRKSFKKKNRQKFSFNYLLSNTHCLFVEFEQLQIKQREKNNRKLFDQNSEIKNFNENGKEIRIFNVNFQIVLNLFWKNHWIVSMHCGQEGFNVISIAFLIN